jgi:hypothetical protein
MSKPINNNKIIYQNIYGRIAQHDGFLNQGVKNNDSPTFANLHLTGDATVKGNLYVEGNTSILNTNVVEIEDNILLLNRLETGAGVTLNQSGIEIERGSLENYRIVYNESDSTFKVGVASNLKPVTIREDSPLSNGIMTWNNTTQRIESKNTISIDTFFNSTTQSTSVTTGAIVISGGIGINKNIYSNGAIYLQGSNHSNQNSIFSNQSTNNLEITSVNNINLTPVGNGIRIPFNKTIHFGSTTQSISANSSNNDINIEAGGNINFNLIATKRISIPNQIPITFSTANEKIYADGSNNMIITGQQDIQLNPGTNQKVLLPVNIPIAFYNSNQRISSNLNGDLAIVASNNINLTPGVISDVIIPVNNGLKFSVNGTQRISANSSNELSIVSSSDLKLNPGTNVTLPVNKFLTFGNNYNQSISADTFGNLNLNAENQIQILNSRNSTNYSNGALVVYGGVGITRDLNVNGNVTFNGNLTVLGNTTTIDTETLLVKDNLVVVNSGPNGSVDGGYLIKRYVNGVDSSSGINYAGIVYKEASDEIIMAYTNESGAIVSDYLPLRVQKVNITSTTNATNISNASLSTPGGAFISKDLIVNGTIYTPTFNVTNASLLNVTSTNLSLVNITSSTLIINSTENSSLFVNGGAVIKGQSLFSNTTPSTSSTQGAVVMSGGLSINCTTNSSGYTNGGALTVSGGASFGGDVWIRGFLNLSTDFSNSIINVTSTKEAVNFSTGALISNGGITIKNTKNSTSVTNGGALLVGGGASIGSDVYIGGKTTNNGEMIIKDKLTAQSSVTYKGGVLFDTIINATTGNLWTYLGIVNDTVTKSYCEINFVNGLSNTEQSSRRTYGIKLVISVNEPNCTVQHSNYGTASTFKVYVYRDVSNKIHVFTLSPEYSTTHIYVSGKTGNAFIINNEGYGLQPSGLTSGYVNTWTQLYVTSTSSSLDYAFGNVTVEGSSLRVVDNMPIVGYNSTSSKDLGFIFERYQSANNSGTGEVVTDTPILTDILPSQSTVTSTQIKLSNSASSIDDYYLGWWIKVGTGLSANQVRKIVGYNGAQRVAELETAWTTQNPTSGDTVYLYNSQYVSFYYDNVDKKFKTVYMYLNELNQTIVEYDYVDLSIKRLDVYDTRSSTNVSSGSMVVRGGVGIMNTVDSSSYTEGGALSIAGGASIGKGLYVGTNIGVGTNNFTIAEGLHINKNIAGVRLENTTGSYSYVDFVENGSNNRFGILKDSNQLSLTYSTNNSNPYNSTRGITMTNSGRIGINTTSNINSPLTLRSNNYISNDLNTGYIGIIGGSSNSNDATVASRINVYGNNHVTTPGDININGGNASGVTTGNIKLSTGNDIERMRITKSGNVYIYSTEHSKSSTTGALIVSGGITIRNTENSSDVSSGGALTVQGGVSINKDMFIGGNVYVTGSIIAGGSTSVPIVSFSNTDNCSVLSTTNLKLIKTSNEALLSFNVKIVPITSSSNCQVEFSIPERTNAFVDRGELIVTSSGYTDDTNVISLFNLISVGIIGTTKGLIKFQSVSTATHYINIICRYTAA